MIKSEVYYRGTREKPSPTMHETWCVGCSYPFFEGLDNKPICEITPSASWYADLDEAIKHWNKRRKE